MKHTLTIIIAIFLTLTLDAQQQVTNNIYLKALTEHLDHLQKLNEERSIYFIEKDWISTENFPSEINGYKIEILEREEIIKKVKGANSIRLLSVRPAQWKNEQMEIHIIEFEVSGDKKNLNYVNQMKGSSFRIISSADCQQLEIEKINN